MTTATLTQRTRHAAPFREIPAGRLRVALFLDDVRDALGGGALSMLRMLDALEARGHAVAVCARSRGAGVVRGRQVHRGHRSDVLARADVILTTPSVARAWGSRLPGSAAVLTHVHSAVHASVRRIPGDVIVWASAGIRDAWRRAGYRHEHAECVQWPLLDPADYRTTPGECVTLVNLQPAKGAALFWALARRMGDVRFLAVVGGWGTQSVPCDLPPNVELLPYQSDPREVYRRTRVLLYPRSKEAGAAWLNGVGLAALEAACSGIPTVAYPGPGLVESLGDAAAWVESYDAAAWEVGIRGALEQWDTLSRAALDVAGRLNPERWMDGTEVMLTEALNAKRGVS